MNTIEYELSPKEHIRFRLKAIFFEKQNILFFIVLLILGALYAIQTSRRVYAPFIALIPVLWFFGTYFFLKYRIKKRDPVFPPRTKLEYDSEKIKFESDKIKMQMSWSCLYKFAEYSEFLAVSFSYYPAFIPKRAFTPEQLEEFKNLLKQNSPPKSFWPY